MKFNTNQAYRYEEILILYLTLEVRYDHRYLVIYCSQLTSQLTSQLEQTQTQGNWPTQKSSIEVKSCTVERSGIIARPPIHPIRPSIHGSACNSVAVQPSILRRKYYRKIKNEIKPPETPLRTPSSVCLCLWVRPSFMQMRRENVSSRLVHYVSSTTRCLLLPLAAACELPGCYLEHSVSSLSWLSPRILDRPPVCYAPAPSRNTQAAAQVALPALLPPTDPP